MVWTPIILQNVPSAPVTGCIVLLLYTHSGEVLGSNVASSECRPESQSYDEDAAERQIGYPK